MSTEPIVEFVGDYWFLSNFSPSPIVRNKALWSTAEHLYQAEKTLDARWKERIRTAPTPGESKRLGRAAPLDKYFERDKLRLMRRVIELKFLDNPVLQAKLLATGDRILIEGNTWHDQFWGDCTCPEHNRLPGRNALGIILMNHRLELRVAKDWKDSLAVVVPEGQPVYHCLDCDEEHEAADDGAEVTCAACGGYRMMEVARGR